jgi:prevent-host-death family protein
MGSVGAYEAKTHLSQLLDRVMKGERITITKHGVPVAVLEPPDSRTTGDVETTIGEIRAFRKAHSLGGHSLKAMIEEGRK